MNIRKPVDYSTMFTALDTLMAASLPQTELYYEIGRLVRARPERGEHLFLLRSGWGRSSFQPVKKCKKEAGYIRNHTSGAISRPAGIILGLHM